jgi:hypothetical protein
MSIQRFATKAEAEATGGQVAWVFDKNGTPWEARTDSDVVADIRPTVTKWQLVQACADAGWTEAQIDASVALISAKRKIFWKYTNIIDRDNPASAGIRANMIPAPTPAQWNAIFLAAAALDPLIV